MAFQTLSEMIPNMLRKLLNKLMEVFDAWIAGLLLAAFGAVFLLPESQMLDWRFKARYLYGSPPRADSNLVVIALFTKKAKESPKVTPRDYLARLLENVSQYNPRVVALDYEFLEDDRSDPEYATLRAAIKKAGHVILPTILHRHTGQYELLSTPPDDLVPFAQTGYATLFNEAVYEMKLQTRLADNRLLASLALTAVAAHLFPAKFFAIPNTDSSAGIDGVANMDMELDLAETDWDTVLQKIRYPVPGETFFPINYVGPTKDHRIPIFRAETFLQTVQSTEFWNVALNNKIVLFGSAYPLAEGTDEFATPFGQMHGVEVHANIINNLLTQEYLKPLGSGWTIFFTMVSLGIVAMSLIWFRLTAAAAATATYIFVYMVAGFWFFATKNLILPLAWPLKAGLFGFLLLYYLQQRGPLRRIREFLDFEILMEGTGLANRYRWRVIQAPGQSGDAKAEVTLSDKAELEKGLKRLQLGRADQAFLQNFGHRLYQYLLVDDIATCYHRGLTQARMEKKGLRIRLRIDAPELQVIPWEYLYDERHNFFLAANREILLTRYVESRAERRDMAVQALNVLIVLSNPKRDNPALLAYPELDVGYEKELIISALNDLRDSTDIPIRYTVLEHAMIDEIRQYLNQDFHIFHFIGHSTFRDGTGQIILEDDKHEALFADEATFGQLFSGSTEMRLVILNSCKSAVSAGLQAISGLAYPVIEAGVPAVVAMQYTIADDTATLFTREFYRALAGGHPVDFAVAHARLAIAQKMKDTRPHDFGIPVLFMRAREGRIV